MLVLSRYAGQTLICRFEEQEIRLRVLDVGWGKVRLGIEAPPDCDIYREELDTLERPFRRPEGKRPLAARMAKQAAD